MVFDPKSIGDHSPVVIHGQNIAQVDSYRYLGIHIDNKLTWSVQVENICSRVQQRLHFLRRLRVFGVNQKVLLLFYHAIVESSILRYGNLSVQLKAQITRLTQTAMKIMAAEADHADADDVCVFLSHGENDHVYAHDAKIRIQDITDLLRGDKCRSLVGKPKIFILQACRGDKHDEPVTPMDVVDSEAKTNEVVVDAGVVYTLPAGADFIMCYSVAEGCI
ncbi:LOW QUALITY PROTEIN: caspase-6-like [Diretmus argenteus]